ncbi:conserved hypothetical protein [Theileria equi strain WA]|uniref:Uncharacterized protein n=1 Tax=Theileria equi strain WA TaxID=1537102 RepID=L1LFW0_THEEQ|nr:conserved hypothetical protein [Theileria equi strain WA]EKX74048.1 conserved hypothetical protein [Theileria equi strain WA]|eukprot:XP_004833500.1 conserved hypothetical protein [Theileria equi strain WA]
MRKFSRIDDRLNYSLRPQAIHLNPLKSGPSCRISVGNVKNSDGTFTAIGGRTSVISTLLFTHEAKNRNIVGSFHKPCLEVYIRPATGTVKSSTRAIEATLIKMMEKIVNSETLGRITLSFRIQILEDSGGLLSVCLNALTICLLISGIEIRELYFAVSFGIVKNEDEQECVILDPTDAEVDGYCSTSLTLFCEPNSGEVALLTIDSGSGCYEDESLQIIKTIAKKASSHYLAQLEELYNESLDAAKITFGSNNFTKS